MEGEKRVTLSYGAEIYRVRLHSWGDQSGDNIILLKDLEVFFNIIGIYPIL